MQNHDTMGELPPEGASATEDPAAARTSEYGHTVALIAMYRDFDDPEAGRAIGVTPEVRDYVVGSCEEALAAYEANPDMSPEDLKAIRQDISEEAARQLRQNAKDELYKS